MWVRTLLALLLCAVCFSLCSESLQYHFVDQSLTWSEAQQFCRRYYSDLACVSSSEDNLRLPRPPGYSAPVWFGLYDDPTDLSQWMWMATKSNGSYENWELGEPRYIHEFQLCSHIQDSTWRCSDCFIMRKGLCYSGSSPKVFHVTPSDVSWAEAVRYCYTHHTDLALIESAEENRAASSVLGNQHAWLGLVRYTGKWSDNRAIQYIVWHQGLSGYKTYQEPFCGAENNNNTWEVFSCQERRPFYCQGEPKTYRVVTMKFSALGLDDPVKNQLILDEIQKRFEAAGRTDVKIKWKTAPEKQKQKNKNKISNCPLNV